MEKGWKNVFTTGDEYLVSIAKELLKEGGIEAVEISHKDSSYVWLGEIELFVRDEDEVQAIEIVKQLNKG
jgi:hypothetical protein